MHVTVIHLSSPNIQHVDLHVHECWELMVVVRGEGIHTVGTRKIAIRPGTIVCQPPHVPHGTESDAGFQNLYIQLNGYQPPCEEEIPVYQDDENRQFETLTRFCLQAFSSRDAASMRLADSLMEAAQQLLVCWSGRHPRDVLVDAFVHELTLGVGDPNLDISDLIRKTGYCSDAFRRRFRAATGTTPTAWLLSQRIRQAQALLSGASDGLSIRQAALLSGFDDPYYFSTLFRRKTGMSPSEYRKMTAEVREKAKKESLPDRQA